MQLPGSLFSAFGALSRAALLCRCQSAIVISIKSQIQQQECAFLPVLGVIRRRFSSLPLHTVLNMPALSPTMSQGNLAKWHVKPGDEVKPGSVLADVETDKAILAFENQDEGFIAKLLVPDGARDIPVGKPVAVLVEEASSVGAFASYEFGRTESTPAPPAASAAPASPQPVTGSSPAPAVAAGKEYPPHTRMTMPSLSPTMDRGNIVSWKVSPGDAIKPGDVLAEIETDKATLSFENVADEGYIATILVPAGSRDVAVGTTVAVVVEDSAAVAAFADYGKQSAAQAAPGGSASVAPTAAAAAPAAPRVVASDRLGPAARILLGASGLAPADVTPTGPNNIITKADVLAAIAAGVKPRTASVSATPPPSEIKPAAPTPAPSAPAPSQPAAKPAVATMADAAPASAAPAAAKPAPAAAASGDRYTDTPNSQIRRIIAKRLLDSKLQTPTMYLAAEARLEGLADLRKALADKGSKVSVNDCVLRAVALALRDVPDANVYWDEAAGGIARFPAVDIAVAVATDRGLITPIVRGADGKGLLAISQEVRKLAGRARENKLKPEEFMGGSFTLSNLGMYGLSYFSAILNPPQAGILAIGGSQERVVLHDGEPAVSSFMTVTLSADSRVYDGELAGAFLAAFRSHIEQPYELIGPNSSSS